MKKPRPGPAKNKINKNIFLKKEVKLSQFVNDTILNTEKPKILPNLLDLIHEFNGVVGYKINTQEQIMQKGNKEIISIYNGVQKNKILKNKFNQGGARVVYRKL